MADVLHRVSDDPPLSLDRRTYQDDQLNKTFAAHQATNSKTLAPQQLVGTSSQRTTRNLSNKSAHDDANDIRPGDSIFQETQVRVQPGQRKVKRQKQHRDEILNLLGQLDSKTAVMRTDQADKEGAKDGMDTDDPWVKSVTGQLALGP